MFTTKNTMKRNQRIPAVLLAILMLSFLFCACSGSSRIYKEGCRAMESGEYLTAISAFESIPDNSDAAAKLPECYYGQGEALALAEDYASAYDYFCKAENYGDAPYQAQKMVYAQGHEAFAAGDYDTAFRFFDRLEDAQENYGDPHFRNLAEATDYLLAQRKNLNINFSFYIDADSDEYFAETLDNIFPVAASDIRYSESEKLLQIQVGEYMPSDKILWAIEHGDYHYLSADELTVMNKAKEVIQEASAAASTPYELELWIHDWICENVSYQYAEYFDPKTYREMSCLGALMDGKADIWGFADSFYLLGRLAGLEVNVVCGQVDGYRSYWNTILLDGKTYIVDTYRDNLESEGIDGWFYVFFNTTPCDGMYMPYGSNTLHPTAAPSGDLSQSYYQHKGAIFTTIEDAADYLVCDYERGGHLWTYAIIEGDPNADSDEIGKALDAKLWKYFRYARTYTWTWWTEPYGNDTHIAVFWKE